MFCDLVKARRTFHPNGKCRKSEDGQVNQWWSGEGDFEGNGLGSFKVCFEFRRRAAGIAPQSGEGEQHRLPLLTERGGVYQVAFCRKKSGSESECFRRDLVDGCKGRFLILLAFLSIVKSLETVPLTWTSGVSGSSV